MKEYLLLMRGGDARMTELDEAATAEHMQKQGAFMQKLTESGNLAGGLPLTAEGVVLSDKSEAISGYLMLKANDYDHAVELTKACPIFEHNGSVEIREAAEMKM